MPLTRLARKNEIAATTNMTPISQSLSQLPVTSGAIQKLGLGLCQGQRFAKFPGVDNLGPDVLEFRHKRILFLDFPIHELGVWISVGRAAADLIGSPQRDSVAKGELLFGEVHHGFR